MTKKDYDDLDDLFNDLEESITNSMLTSVDQKVKKIYRNNVDKMYHAYTPSHYQRRMENGGFGDEDNWHSNIDYAGDAFEYVMTNETEPSNYAPYRLDEIIEEGIYDWKRRPQKREVYFDTQNEIDSSNEIENAIYKDLKDWF